MKHTKRLISLLLALVLALSLLPTLPVFAASYNLKVNGIQVTDSNKNNILGDADKTVTYNSSSKMLTINGNFETTSTWAITSEIPNLTIYVAKDALINAASGGIRCKNGVAFGGPGNLTINAQVDSGIFVDKPDSGQSSDITLFNVKLSILAAGEGITFSDDSRLNVMDSTLGVLSVRAGIDCDNVELITSSVTSYSTNDRAFRGGSHSSNASLTVYSSEVNATGYSISVGEYKTISLIGDSYLESGSYSSKEVKIKRDDSAKYNLLVGGRQVSDKNKADILGDGAFSFDSSSNTLSIKKNYTYKPAILGGTVFPAVLSNMTLNVSVPSDVTLNAGDADAFFMTGSSFTTLTLKGAGKLSLKAKGVAFNMVGDDSTAHDLVFDGAKVDVTDTGCKNGILGSEANGTMVQLKNNANVKLYVGGTAINNCCDVYLNDSYLYAEANNGGCYGMYGPYGSGTSSYVKVINSGLYAHGAKGAIVNFGKITATNSTLTTPAGGSYDTGTVYTYGTTIAATAEFTAATMYDLWLKGTQVSSTNKDNILGDNTASYDPSTKTLTLKGDLTAVDESVLRSKIDGLIIKPAKDLSLVSSNKNAVQLEATANITGGGKITIYASNGHGIFINSGTLALKDADVSITCSGTSKDGMYGNGAAQLVLNNSRVEIDSDRYAISNFAGGIHMTEEVIESPAGAAVSGSFIKLDGLPVQDLLIVPNEKFPLYVCDTQVTRANANDILGDGTFRYDPVSEKLWINKDCTYSGTIIYNAGVKYLSFGYTNNVTLNNTSTTPTIMLADDTIFSNDPTLMLMVKGKGIGIRCDFYGSLIIDPAYLKVQAGTYGLYSQGTTKLVIDNGYVVSDARDGAIVGFKEYEFGTVSIIEPVGGKVDGVNIVNPDNSVATYVVIDNYNPSATYTIDFNMKGHGTAPASQSVSDGNTVTKPADPTASGWTFGGWYTNFDCTMPYDFSLPVHTSFTLFAKWTEVGVTTYTVKFDANGHGTAPAAQTVEAGKTATEPTAPVAAGWVFGGWYKEKACTNKFDFSTPITANITLYAKWTQETVPTYTVTFQMNGHGTQVPAQSVQSGKTATEPTPPSEAGYIFKGWFSDPACTSPFDFSMPIYMDITIYALWDTEPFMHYDLYINGVEVTTANRMDVLSDGVFSFDGVKTLTLNGSFTSGTVMVIDSRLSDLIISLASDSTLAWENITTIYSQGDLTIKGNGHKLIWGETAVSGDLTIENLASGSKLNGFNLGLYSFSPTGKLTIRSSELRIKAPYGAIDAFGGGVELDWCTVTSPKGAKIVDGRLLNKDGSTVTDCTIAINPFKDVKKSDYYYNPVLWAFYHEPNQITNGTDDSHFSPKATCTRGQIVTFLWRANGCPEPITSDNPFKDVPASQYYYKAVLWAFENGITNGVDDTHFGPNQKCKREHAVTFLYRSAGSPAYSTSSNPFTDVKPSAYYYDAVLWAVENGVTNGTSPTTFSPAQPCQRCQIVTFLYRALVP